ncbi:hypothetical protein [Paracoccus sp. JM45]|uniref:hypothetical protein n=1 Tax=Paracoccus sp. JM45 TaxID=2283626 RepID=UPI0011C42D1B|nr:hypothetical protein [Paracoccus sp. JM45]
MSVRSTNIYDTHGFVRFKVGGELGLQTGADQFCVKSEAINKAVSWASMLRLDVLQVLKPVSERLI